MNWQHAAIGVGATVSALAVAPVLGVSLPLLGFTATGIAGSSTAAIIQSFIGNVGAGSLFATCQTIGMGGAVPAVYTAIGGGIGAVATAIGVGTGADDEDGVAGAADADLVAAWAHAEVLAAAALIEAAAAAQEGDQL